MLTGKFLASRRSAGMFNSNFWWHHSCGAGSSKVEVAVETLGHIGWSSQQEICSGQVVYSKKFSRAAPDLLYNGPSRLVWPSIYFTRRTGGDQILGVDLLYAGGSYPQVTGGLASRVVSIIRLPSRVKVLALRDGLQAGKCVPSLPPRSVASCKLIQMNLSEVRTFPHQWSYMNNPVYLTRNEADSPVEGYLEVTATGQQDALYIPNFKRQVPMGYLDLRGMSSFTGFLIWQQMQEDLGKSDARNSLSSSPQFSQFIQMTDVLFWVAQIPAYLAHTPHITVNRLMNQDTSIEETLTGFHGISDQPSNILNGKPRSSCNGSLALRVCLVWIVNTPALADGASRMRVKVFLSLNRSNGNEKKLTRACAEFKSCIARDSLLKCTNCSILVRKSAVVQLLRKSNESEMADIQPYLTSWIMKSQYRSKTNYMLHKIADSVSTSAPVFLGSRRPVAIGFEMLCLWLPLILRWEQFGKK
ncbi:hypothetical protein DFH06DRAFT_1123978 [Mycena polygramma]|nr:hypothetical protein DFH06DRAFT_1123978 [Mycena polygramma]